MQQLQRGANDGNESRNVDVAAVSLFTMRRKRVVSDWIRLRVDTASRRLLRRHKSSLVSLSSQINN